MEKLETRGNCENLELFLESKTNTSSIGINNVSCDSNS